MLRKILATVLLFLLFYNPPILGYRCLRLLIIISLAYIFLNNQYVARYILNKRFFEQYLIWSFIIIYILIVGSISGNGVNYIAGQVYWLVSVVPTSIVISCLIKKEQLGFKGLIDCSLIAGSIQGVMATLAFFSPQIKQAFISSMISGHVFEENAYTYELIYRMFGYSSGLTFGMPALQAFLTMLALYMAINYKTKYALLIPLLAFSAVINARTSFVIFLVCGIIIVLQRNWDNPGKIFRVIAVCIVSVFAFIMFVPILRRISPETFNWINRGINELLFASRGDLDQGYFSYLFNKDKWIFPNGLGVIFGYGIRVMGNNKYDSATDIGIVNDIWFGGIIYVLFVYYLFILYCRKIKRIDYKQTTEIFDYNIRGIGRYLFYAFLVCAIFLNLKTYIIDIHALSMFFISVLIYADFFDNCETSTITAEPRRRKIRFVFGR